MDMMQREREREGLRDMEITERSVTTEVHAFIHKEGETFTMFTHIDTYTLHNMLDKEREKEGYRVR